MSPRSWPAHRSRPSRAAAALGDALAAGAAALALAACAGPRQGALPPWEPVPVPGPEAVESVIFLIGDPGVSDWQRAPILSEIAREVEEWSGELGRDSAVAVLVLGDIVYPRGMRDPGTEEFAGDSLHVEAQIDMVDGPLARRYATAGYFLAGNHDWGMARGIEGKRRITNMGDFLKRNRVGRGLHVELIPPAGEPGPGVIDVGANLRMILLDTAWWLLAWEPQGKPGLIARIEEAIAGAGDRHILIAAHHPWRTGGPHGGLVDFWSTFGVRWFLNKTGSLLQDINSRPMQDLRLQLEEIFQRHRRPLLFVGGHDHSLQVMEGVKASDPLWIAVSGTGSKVSDVADAPGMRFRAEKVGYMTLLLLRDGGAILYVRGADEDWVGCPNDLHEDPVACMAAAPRAFDTLFSTRLHGGS
ncbi:MAG TPA: hypothetical protein VMM12_03045 [Longimicrobiales bacterium]|nr:hypothetical protein [Longimicrobiales bacterium]